MFINDLIKEFEFLHKRVCNTLGNQTRMPLLDTLADKPCNRPKCLRRSFFQKLIQHEDLWAAKLQVQPNLEANQ